MKDVVASRRFGKDFEELVDVGRVCHIGLGGESLVDGKVRLEPYVGGSNGADQTNFFVEWFFLGRQICDHTNAPQMILRLPDDHHDIAMMEHEVLLILEVLLHILRSTLPQLLQISVDGPWARGQVAGKVMVALGIGWVGLFEHPLVLALELVFVLSRRQIEHCVLCLSREVLGQGVFG